jgi:pimeloyl-ACP methyl ester carboxylesterase
MRTSSGEELTDEQLAFVTDPGRLVADSIGVYFQPVHYSVTAGIPTTYVVSRRDTAVPPPLQREMAARLPGPAEVVEIDAGHLMAVTDPEALADLILAV